MRCLHRAHGSHLQRDSSPLNRQQRAVAAAEARRSRRTIASLRRATALGGGGEAVESAARGGQQSELSARDPHSVAPLAFTLLALFCFCCSAVQDSNGLASDRAHFGSHSSTLDAPTEKIIASVNRTKQDLCIDVVFAALHASDRMLQPFS